MRIAVCIQNEKTRILLAGLLKIYEEQNGCHMMADYFITDFELTCDMAGGEYDAIFFGCDCNDRFTKDVREKDRHVRLVRITATDSEISYNGDVWYCLAEPLSHVFLFPVLDRLQGDAGHELDAGLLVKSRGSILQLAFSQIEYVEVMGRTVFFHLINGIVHGVSGSFSDFDDRLLNRPDFIKIHRSYIINMRYVQKLESSAILTMGGHSVPISKHIYSQFKKDYLCSMMDPEAKEEHSQKVTPTEISSSENISVQDGYSVLLVDDEEEQRLRFTEVLTSHGCTVQTAYNSETSRKLAQSNNYDCVVLDVKLGQISGFDICAMLAELTGAPVIFLSNFDDNESQTKGFLSGGTDYISKSATDELFWLKIDTLIKMSRSGKVELNIGKLRLNLKERTVFWLGKEISLTTAEFELFSIMMKSPGEVFTPARLYEAIWGAKQWDGGQGVQLHLSLLSRKLSNICTQHSFIETVWGKGYRFVPMPKDTGGGNEKQEN